MVNQGEPKAKNTAVNNKQDAKNIKILRKQQQTNQD
jgi:hypothetical protein